MQIIRKNHKELNYLIRFPDGYTEGERYPVIFFLHGAGSRGNSLDHLLKNVYFSYTEQHKGFPFVTVAPQCSDNTWYDMLHLLKELLAITAESDFADPERIYLMGASMGGYATWQLAMSRPELVAAIVPICGRGAYWNAARLKNVPVWAHHGALDDVVYLDETEKMVNAVNKSGGSAKLTIYPDVSHASWVPTYKNYEVFEWLLSHKLHRAEVAHDKYNDVTKYG